MYAYVFTNTNNYCGIGCGIFYLHLLSFIFIFNCVDLPARLPATVISGRDGCNPDDLTDYLEGIQYQYLELLDDILHHLGQ